MQLRSTSGCSTCGDYSGLLHLYADGHAAKLELTARLVMHVLPVSFWSGSFNFLISTLLCAGHSCMPYSWVRSSCDDSNSTACGENSLVMPGKVLNDNMHRARSRCVFAFRSLACWNKW